MLYIVRGIFVTKETASSSAAAKQWLILLNIVKCALIGETKEESI